MATLQDIIDQIQDLIGAISGIRYAPDEPPETADFYPFAVAYSESGQWEQRQSKMEGTHVIAVELHVARKNLPWDIEAAMGYAKSIPNAILQGSRSGNISGASFIGPIYYVFGPMSWDVTETLGFRFTVEGIRTEDALT